MLEKMLSLPGSLHRLQAGVHRAVCQPRCLGPTRPERVSVRVGVWDPLGMEGQC